MESYDVVYRGETVGKATLEWEGLYRIVSCRCKMLDGIFRLAVRTEKGTVTVGVCAPEKGELRIRRKIAAGNIGDDVRAFVLIGEQGCAEEQFVPLGEQLSTDSLRALAQARFRIQEGRPGLVFDQPPGKI